MRKETTYLVLILATAALVLGAIAAVNLVVDPFNMYGLYTRQGFNTYKPAIYNRVRLLKAYEVRKLQPESVVLGSSRVHVGMRPSHKGWASLYDKRYNLAFDAATTKEMYAYLLHANGHGNLKQAMLGVDIHQLNDFPSGAEASFNPLLLMNQYTWFNVPRMAAADFTVLTSVDTLKESLNTIHSQDKVEPQWLAPDGQRLGQVFFHLPWTDYMKCGPRCYFDEIDQREMGFKLGWEAEHAPDKPIMEVPAEMDPALTYPAESSIGYVHKIVDYCQKYHIKLIVFITPSHAHQLEITAAVHKWNLMENGKRKLVKMLAEANKDYPDEQVPLYDFSGYSSITTETLPPEGSRQEMQYYWENSHFKEVVGDMVLDRLLGTTTAGHPVPADFGVLLTPQNIEEALAADRRKQVEYRQSHAQEISMITDWVRAYKKQHGMVE